MNGFGGVFLHPSPLHVPCASHRKRKVTSGSKEFWPPLTWARFYLVRLPIKTQVGSDWNSSLPTSFAKLVGDLQSGSLWSVVHVAEKSPLFLTLVVIPLAADTKNLICNAHWTALYPLDEVSLGQDGGIFAQARLTCLIHTILFCGNKETPFSRAVKTTPFFWIHFAE